MAAGRKDVQAGAAYVTLFVKNSAFIKGLRDAESRLNKMADGLKAIGAKFLAVGAMVQAPFAAATAEYAKAGTGLDRLAQRLQVSTEQLSALGYAAETVGGDIGTVESAITALRDKMAGARLMDPAALKSLAMLELTLGDIENLSAGQQLELVADQISRIADPALQAQRATELLGGSAETLLPILRQGAAGFQNLADEAQRVGAVMRQGDAAAARELTRDFQRLTASVTAVWRAVASALAPAVHDIMETLQPLVKGLSEWVKANRETVVTIAKVGAAALAIGAGVGALGIVVAKVGAILGTLAVAATGVTAAIATGFALIVSPVGLAVAAIGGLYVSINGLAKTWDNAKKAATATGDAMRDIFGRVRSALNPLMTDLRNATRGVMDAIKAGDVTALFDVLKAAGTAITLQLQKQFLVLWWDVKNTALDAFDAIWNRAADGLDSIRGAFSSVWSNVFSWLTTGWGGFVAGMKSTALEAISVIGQELIGLGKLAIKAAPLPDLIRQNLKAELGFAEVGFNRSIKARQEQVTEQGVGAAERDRQATLKMQGELAAAEKARVDLVADRQRRADEARNNRRIEQARSLEELETRLTAARIKLQGAAYDAQVKAKLAIPLQLQGEPGKPIGALGARTQFGTFSAQAAQMMAGARETKLEKIATQQAELQKQQLAKMDAQIEELKKFKAWNSVG